MIALHVGKSRDGISTRVAGAWTLALLLSGGGWVVTGHAQAQEPGAMPMPTPEEVMTAALMGESPWGLGGAGQGNGDAGDDSEGEERKIAMSFRDADMQQIAMFLMRELGKPVIVNDAVRENRLTILSPDELPAGEALELLGNALRQKGVMIVEGLNQVELLPIDAAKRVNRQVVGEDESVADVDDKSRIIDKVFVVEHYDVLRLKDIVLPMLPDYAFVVADPNVNRLVVTAAAADLLHIEELVERIDVPRANDTVQRIIPVRNGDASEIVNLVRTILSGTLGVSASEIATGQPGAPQPSDRQRDRRGGGRGNQPQTNITGPGTFFVERSDAPILLYADLSRNWIIAAASPSVMEQIEKWVKELDVKQERDEPYALVDVEHADVAELAVLINEAIASMPDADIRTSVRVIPFPTSRQLLVYGSMRGRALVASLLEQLDVKAVETRVMKEIQLENDTAENVKMKIEELFGTNQAPLYQGRGRYVPAPNTVEGLTVTADPQRNTVTILTDPDRLERIERVIREQWDRPLDLDEAQPKVYELKYVDPVLVTTLLEDMFSRSSSTTSFNWRSGTATTESDTPVGRLFGEFSFVAMENSNKLIVSTKNRANYKVIDDLIEEIDTPQDAGVPVVIELKHANAEDVAEQLNAMFAEAGTPSSITRNERGLSAAIRQSSFSSTDTDSGNQGNQNRQTGGGEEATDPMAMTFWWSQSRPTTTEQPTSNLIGKPRIVPVNRRNAVMVLAPRAHIEPLRELITELDKPGSQVVIHAIITEVEHSDETTLGVRFASDPSLFNDSGLLDQSIGGGVNASVAEPIFGGDGVLNANLNVNLLIQLLQEKLNLKVLNEPRVYTADNEEAHFFDGQDVPVVVEDQTNSNNNDNDNITRSFTYRPVGTRLHVRPHITQEGEVNLEVNLELSRIATGATVFGNFIFDRRETTTNVTVADGQTIVISGIVNQEDFLDVRKLPLLGDLPLIGALFRSTDASQRNREIIAFITPHIVAATGTQADEATIRNRAWLDRIRGAMEPPRPEEDDERLITRPEERELQGITAPPPQGPAAPTTEPPRGEER